MTTMQVYKPCAGGVYTILKGKKYKSNSSTMLLDNTDYSRLVADVQPLRDQLVKPEDSNNNNNVNSNNKPVDNTKYNDDTKHNKDADNTTTAAARSPRLKKIPSILKNRESQEGLLGEADSIDNNGRNGYNGIEDGRQLPPQPEPIYVGSWLRQRLTQLCEEGDQHGNYGGSRGTYEASASVDEEQYHRLYRIPMGFGKVYEFFRFILSVFCICELALGVSLLLKDVQIYFEQAAEDEYKDYIIYTSFMQFLDVIITIADFIGNLEDELDSRIAPVDGTAPINNNKGGLSKKAFVKQIISNSSKRSPYRSYDSLAASPSSRRSHNTTPGDSVEHSEREMSEDMLSMKNRFDPLGTWLFGYDKIHSTAAGGAGAGDTQYSNNEYNAPWSSVPSSPLQKCPSLPGAVESLLKSSGKGSMAFVSSTYKNMWQAKRRISWADEKSIPLHSVIPITKVDEISCCSSSNSRCNSSSSGDSDAEYNHLLSDEEDYDLKLFSNSSFAVDEMLIGQDFFPISTPT